MPIRVIDAATIRELLTPRTAIDVIDAAMREVSRGNVEMPQRWGLKLPNSNGAMGMMPGYLGSPECHGIKLVSLFPGNRTAGLPSHLGLIVLFESQHGQPIALLDGDVVTSLRTAAASAVATRALARPDASQLTILGTGQQARAHLHALLAVRAIERVRIWGRNTDKAEQLARELDTDCGTRVEAWSDVELAVNKSDIVCTVTGAAEPILLGKWLSPGTHLNLVGSSVPNTRETDSEAVRRARFFVDYRDSAFTQAGELLTAIRDGVVGNSHIIGEIGEVLLQQSTGRDSYDEITIYKSLGVAAQDLAAAMTVYLAAEANDRGTVIAI